MFEVWGFTLQQSTSALNPKRLGSSTGMIEGIYGLVFVGFRGFLEVSGGTDDFDMWDGTFALAASGC